MENAPENKPSIWQIHGKTITITAVVTSLLVGLLGLYYGIYNSNQKPASFIERPETKSENGADLKIKGNKNSKIYHLPGCPNYDDIAERNIVWFKTREEAEQAGFRMAKNCP